MLDLLLNLRKKSLFPVLCLEFRLSENTLLDTSLASFAKHTIDKLKDEIDPARSMMIEHPQIWTVVGTRRKIIYRGVEVEERIDGSFEVSRQIPNSHLVRADLVSPKSLQAEVVEKAVFCGKI